MSTHQFNPKMLPDEQFAKGELKYIVVGNECRLLDRRRTPGIVRSIDIEGGFFRWEITDFEDMGKYWDVPLEDVVRFQFKIGSEYLDSITVTKLQEKIVTVDKISNVAPSISDSELCSKLIGECVSKVSSWLDLHSQYFSKGHKLDFTNKFGPESLRDDFMRYLKSVDLWEVEKLVSEVQVMNPQSGDTIKALQIVMAEMGVKPYQGKWVRSPSAFEGLCSKDKLKTYIEHRIGFIRAFYAKIGLQQVTLYRGMSTEWAWQPDTKDSYRFWSSWTFSYDVAKDFSDLSPGNKHQNSYLIKRAIPVEKLFMTYLETESMNKQYIEAEAIVLHSDEDRQLW
jgi:hypothetical protein